MPLDVRPLVAPATTALVLNEVQPSTVTGPGQLAVAGAAVLPAIERLTEGAREAGVKVIHAVKVFRRDSLARNRNVLLYRRRGQVPTAPPDSRPVDGSVPELPVDERDLVLSRLHGMGAATDTGMVPVLRNLGIGSVIVAGVSLNIGIPNTVMHLVDFGFEVIVPRDAVAGVPAQYAELVLEHTIKFLATVTSVDHLLTAWSV